ncbi:MAG: hypothetical protein ACYS0C_03790 [Planctomycetota bacterium]|jgi:hypothetical protein
MKACLKHKIFFVVVWVLAVVCWQPEAYGSGTRSVSVQEYIDKMKAGADGVRLSGRHHARRRRAGMAAEYD